MSTSTNYLNSLKRRIQVGPRGGYFVQDSKGKKVYGVKARYRKVGSTNVTKIANHMAVPTPIRRKVRSNKGVARVKKVSAVSLRRSPVKSTSPSSRSLLRMDDSKYAHKIPYKRVFKSLMDDKKVVITIKNKNYKDADFRSKEFVRVEFVSHGSYISYRYIDDWSRQSLTLDFSKLKNFCDELSQIGPSFLTVTMS